MNQDTSIRSIETKFQGYHFRSRLEARWAVFFNKLGIDFWYEPEGYEFNGMRYLPDFYLPQVGMIAEVKPSLLTVSERSKAERLCLHLDKPIVLLVGPPDFKVYDCLWKWADGEIVSDDVLLDVDCHYRRYYQDEHRFYASCGGFWTLPEHFTKQYKEAVYASREARFDAGDATK